MCRSYACNYFSTQFDNVDYTNVNCSFPGCLDESYVEFDLSSGCSSPDMCLTPVVYGCTDASALILILWQIQMMVHVIQ